MPVYRCSSRAGAVPAELRPRIAREFTRIHSELTGAPAGFVHVHFVDLEGDNESGAETSYEIHGTIRAGRTADVRTQLVDQLTTTFSEITMVAPGDVTMSLTEVPASWIMEGGEIAPQPGNETRWLERHSGPRNN